MEQRWHHLPAESHSPYVSALEQRTREAQRLLLVCSRLIDDRLVAAPSLRHKR